MVTDSADVSDYARDLIDACEDELMAVSQVHFTTTLRILEEAWCCYRNHCYVASCAMCRGVVESILNTFRVWRREANRYSITKISKSTLSELIKWAKAKEILDSETEKLAKDVTEKGNLSSHFAQRIDTARFEQRATTHGIWITKEESLETLRKTVKLLMEIAPLGHAKMGDSN